MRNRDRARASEIRQLLRRYITDAAALPGIGEEAYQEAFVEQLIESLRRVDFVATIRSRDISSHRADPSSHLFDPIRAAILLMEDRRSYDEACWLIFLSTLFGKHLRNGWITTAQVYGALGDGEMWTFARVKDNPSSFRAWLEDHQNEITRRVGNHRKYLSLSGLKPHGAGAAVQTYVEWVGAKGTHRDLFDNALQMAKQDAKGAFAYLFDSMKAVESFGRTGKFDYLTMIGKVGIAPLLPDSAHLVEATGPLIGARLLFSGSKRSRTSSSILNKELVRLGDALQLRMDVLEDAICNWQKNPGNFVPFRG